MVKQNRLHDINVFYYACTCQTAIFALLYRRCCWFEVLTPASVHAR